MNARIATAAALAALVSPLAANAGSVTVGTAYNFDLNAVDEAFVDSALTYPGVDGYFVGFQQLDLAGFTAATGLSIDRLESVELRIEGKTGSPGSGGVYAATGAAVPGAISLLDQDLFATEDDAVNGRGITIVNVASRFDGNLSDADLAAFDADRVTLGVFSNIAFYGSLGQVDGGSGFSSAGFAGLTYNFSDAVAVPTPSAALAGLIGLGTVALRRRRSAEAAA